jgi:hypothetical protein
MDSRLRGNDGPRFRGSSARSSSSSWVRGRRRPRRRRRWLLQIAAKSLKALLGAIVVGEPGDPKLGERKRRGDRSIKSADRGTGDGRRRDKQGSRAAGRCRQSGGREPDGYWYNASVVILPTRDIYTQIMPFLRTMIRRAAASLMAITNSPAHGRRLKIPCGHQQTFHPGFPSAAPPATSSPRT